MAKEKFKKPLTKEALSEAEKNLAQDRARYDVLKQDYEGLSSKLEKEFEENLEGMLSQEEMDVLDLDSDQVKKYRLLMEKRKKYIDDVLEENKSVLDAMEDAIDKKETALEFHRAEVQFGESNPDIDFEAFAEWLQTDLAPRELRALQDEAEGDKAKFLELASAKFAQSNGVKSKKEEVDLPTDLTGVAGATGDIDNGDSMASEDDSFAEQSGLYR